MSRPHEESEAEVKAAAGAWDPGHHTADTPEPPAEEGSSGDLSSLAGSFAAQAALRERQQGAKGAEGSRGAPFLPARPPAGGAGEERAAAGAPPPGSPLHPGVGPEAKASEAKSQVPGEPVDLGLKALDMGRDLLQSFAPVKAVHEHVCAWHYYAHDQTRQVEAHHYCSHPSAEVRQCLLFDSDQPGARLIGLEYIISERLFKELPEEEKRYWHSHRYEVGSGLLVAPRVPGIAERQDMQRLIGTYGKAWHTWQIRPGLVAQRDARYGISTAGEWLSSRGSAPYTPPGRSNTSGAGSGASSGFRSGPVGAPPPADAAALAKRLAELQDLLREAAQIALATGPRGIQRSAQAAAALLSVARDQAERLRAGQPPESPAAVLRKLFERLGATYIKLGQFVASSPTLFPEEYVLEFQKCLDSTEPVPFETIRRTVESELGMSLEDVFASVDREPLATASIAQVHSAVLRGSNKEVVIKVLKPGVEDVLTTDLNFLYLSSRFLEFLQPDLARTSLSAVVGDIRASMLEEVDFRKEAQHVAQFADYLERGGLRRVATCPSVYRQFSTQRVMTMDRLCGVPLTDLNAIRSITSVDPESVLINALNTWFGSVVGCETFHADVHAGNLLVLPDGRVAFIDFGIVGRISPVTWRAIEALLLATGAADYDTMARALITIGATSEEVDLKAFAADLEKLFSSLQAIDAELIVQAGAGGTVNASVAADDAAVNRFLLDLVRVGENNGIRFPREFALLIKQLLYFDRYNRILAPQLRVFDDRRINLRQVDLDFELN
ncbi:hypothetical protein C2E20_8783 [Micractinium conductrix]|uniref:ABC1 atypical kinase-like domain-containing protein n=1 Tax=Micractinium conductrix TaxID=554055 RepID=A0A2P6V0D6_9CHLO|nr:hypothetical protein C2E20_8783 [Micractinium conductrix]|eukprot:PSC67556.1 hypothetical protein C2E20_8783 [Micractinium conductrix]